LQSFCENVSKILSKYDINIHGLEEKRYTFDFEGSDDFFEAFEPSFIEKGHFVAKVNLIKNSTLIQLDFEITGSVEVTCDRSLELYDEPFVIHERFIYKYGEKHEEVSDEMEIIPRGAATINIAQHIYDFIAVSLPMKKLHPKFRDEDFDEDGKLVYSSESTQEENDDEQEIDPRWAALSQLKKKN